MRCRNTSLSSLFLGTGMVLICNISMSVQGQATGYFVSFTNKDKSTYSIDKPSEFLSERAINRRIKQGIAIDSTDLPVSKVYTDSLKVLGFTIHHTTKWLNGAIISCHDPVLVDTLDQYGFIKGITINKGSDTNMSPEKLPVAKSESLKSEDISSIYGAAHIHIRTVNGLPLHQKGFTGKGIHIAVIDAGFYKANEMPLLTHLFENGNILGSKDFVTPSSNFVDQHTHGMQVLSIMGGKLENQYIGTAPDASYWLLRSEEDGSEYPIEADYWICAAEFADSMGVDIINTSLGYTVYDNPLLNLTPSDLNGSSRISQAAAIAADKGMVVVISAGNEGSTSWKYISTPSDAKNVLSVAAVDRDSTRASFSSAGPPGLSYIKPDLAAMGVSVAVQGTDGLIRYGSGTSYAAPIISGMAACLWQSLPELSSKQIMHLIRKSCNSFESPNEYTGYGIPDFHAAYLSGNMEHGDTLGSPYLIWPVPFKNEIHIRFREMSEEGADIGLFSANGVMVRQNKSFHVETTISQTGPLSSGVYFLRIRQKGKTTYYKLIKN